MRRVPAMLVVLLGCHRGAEVSAVCASSAEEATVMVCRWDGIGK